MVSIAVQILEKENSSEDSLGYVCPVYSSQISHQLSYYPSPREDRLMEKEMTRILQLLEVPCMGRNYHD